MVTGQDGRVGVHVLTNAEVDIAFEHDRVTRLRLNMAALSAKEVTMNLNYVKHNAVLVSICGGLSNNKRRVNVKTSLSLKLINFRRIKTKVITMDYLHNLTMLLSIHGYDGMPVNCNCKKVDENWHAVKEGAAILLITLLG